MAEFETTAAPAGQESFIQRQRRLMNYSSSQPNSQPQQYSGGPILNRQTMLDPKAPIAQGPRVVSYSGTPQTPVTGNGKIPDPQPTAAPGPKISEPAPAPAPAPAPKPSYNGGFQPPPGVHDPIPGGNGVYDATTGAWVPKNHPAAAAIIAKFNASNAPAAPGAAAPPANNLPAGAVSVNGQVQNPGPQTNGSPLQGMNLGNEPFKTYIGTTFNTPIPETQPLPDSYKGTTFSQFEAPDTQQNEGLTSGLLTSILQNPRTLNDAVLGGMKEKNKEQLLLAQRQAEIGARRDAAARGLHGGGSLDGRLAQIAGNTGNALISGNRDLDIQAAAKNREDELNALAAADSVLNGQVGRAGDIYKNTLAGQVSQASDDQTVSQSAINRAIAGNTDARANAALGLQKEGMQAAEDYKQFGTERDAQDAAIQRVLQQFGINSDVAGGIRSDKALDLQGELGRAGINVDLKRLAEQGREFNASNLLDQLRLAEMIRQFNGNQAFNYDQLGMNGQNGLMNFILGLLK